MNMMRLSLMSYNVLYVNLGVKKAMNRTHARKKKRNSDVPRTPEKVTGSARSLRINPLKVTLSEMGFLVQKSLKMVSSKNFFKKLGIKGRVMSDYRGRCGRYLGYLGSKSCEFGSLIRFAIYRNTLV